MIRITGTKSMRLRTMRTNKAPSGTVIKTSLQSLEASVDVKAIRSEKYQGRDYLAVPVIALVEGVLQGMNSPVPELALAAEFGKYPQGWNGRPVVMNHPEISGVSVSAGEPAILEVWAFGQMFNTVLDGKKLKTEAWIDIELANAKGGEFESTLARLQEGTLVEVSVGCFVSTFSAKGIYNGKAYKAVWTDVVPDHLAMLSEGVLGACSVETGCGAPRLNQGKDMKVTITNHTDKKVVTTPKPTVLADPTLTGSCDKPGCACGGHVHANEDAAELLEELQADQDALMSFSRHLAVEAIPDTLFTDDIRRMLSKAVRSTYKASDGEPAFLIGFTTELAVYEVWISGMGYCTYQVPFTMDTSGTVTFTGEPTQINLITQIVPVSTNQGKDDPMTTTAKTPAELAAEAAKTTPPAKPATSTAAATPPNPTVTPPSDKSVEQPVTPVPVPPPTNAAANAAAAFVDFVKKPVTLAGYIAEAPDELKEVLSEGVRLQAAKKATLVKGLLDTKERCAFDEVELKAMSVMQLEKLTRLAELPDYSGGAGERQAEANPSANAANGNGAYMEAPAEPLFAPQAKQ